MYYCADCAYMDVNPKSSGKFRCEKARRSGYSDVSARMCACPEFIDSFISKRSVTDRNNLMAISKKHGFYIVTALTKILNLDNSYIEAFRYFKENILVLDDYQEFLEEYENLAPYLADLLLKDDGNILFAMYLYTNYLIKFKECIDNCKFDQAFDVYFELYGLVCDRYNMLNKDNDSNVKIKKVD